MSISILFGLSITGLVGSYNYNLISEYVFNKILEYSKYNFLNSDFKMLNMYVENYLVPVANCILCALGA